MTENTNPTETDEYAKAVCDGLNFFLGHDSDIRFVYSIDNTEKNTEITFVPEQTEVESAPTYEYTVEDQGEQLEFSFDGKELSIIGCVDDWSVFDYQLHTGEAISCIIEAGDHSA